MEDAERHLYDMHVFNLDTNTSTETFSQTSVCPADLTKCLRSEQ